MEPPALSRKSALLLVWVVWIALLSGLLGYYVVLGSLREGAPPSTMPDAGLVRAFVFAAVAAAGISLALRRILLGGFRAGTVSLETPAGTKRFLTGNIVCFALSEVPGIFGLVLGLMGLPLTECAKFFISAFALMAWHIPLPGRFEPGHDPLLRS